MKTAHNEGRVKRIPSATKCAIAIQAISRQQTITAIAKEFDCSRTTVHEQKNRALEAATNAFEEADEETLFTISVTKSWIHKIVVALFLIGGASYRGILFFLESILDYSLSLGTVFNILDAAADKAAAINEAYDLSAIQSSAADEVFHRNQPILGVVDIESRYCALLAQSNDRDHESWAIHLLYLQARGYAPGASVIDSAKGLIKGHEIVLPKTALRHDHFHLIRDLKECGRFLKNELASRTTQTLKLVRRAEKAQEMKTKKACNAALSSSLAQLTALEQTYATFQLLAQWLQYDVLQLAGYQPDERTKLYDFIVAEMTILAKQHPHRISAIATSLTHQRDALLDVANALNDQFAQLAKRYKASISAIWDVCHTARYGIDSCRYHERSSELEAVIGKQYEEIEDAVLSILEKTHRCSSMVENLNSRVRPYLDERKCVSQKILGLVQFYLNHKPFMRSTHERLVNKTPAEAMTGKPHQPWLEMLGFPSNIRLAA
jgi:transposase-like protein/23S rRNA maturation mini-RNase III